MDKNRIENPINVQHVIKLSKYQAKLATLAGGSGEKHNIYKYKINEYSDKLASNGFNVNKIKQVMQKGGATMAEVLEELERQKTAILTRISDITITPVVQENLADNVQTLINAANEAKTRYDAVSLKYQDAATGLNRAFATSKINNQLALAAAARKSAETAVPVNISLTPDQLSSVTNVTQQIVDVAEPATDMKEILAGVMVSKFATIPHDSNRDHAIADAIASAQALITDRTYSGRAELEAYMQRIPNFPATVGNELTNMTDVLAGVHD